MKRTRLRQERLKHGLSYQDVADKLGISSVYVRKIESGDRNPGFVTALRFGNLFGASVKELFPDIFYRLLIQNVPKKRRNKWITLILKKSSNMLANQK